ncbi:hypothetical protein P2318_01540 [Myxococcaceae bacterium GXIMD 01537]
MSLRLSSRLLPLLALVPLSLAGCGGEEEEHLHHGHTATESTCPPAGAPTAQDFGTAFMESYCVSCHSTTSRGPSRGGAPTDLNFDTLEGIRRYATDIDAHAAAGPRATNTAMPPADRPQPTLAEREKLGQWLACGAP